MWRYLLILWSVVLLLSACGKQVIKKESLNGAWEIVSASRNGKPTETLNGAILRLNHDSLYTNLLGDEEHTAYNYHKQKITSLRSTGDSLILKVISLEQDVLLLQTEIQNFIFDLELRKKIQ